MRRSASVLWAGVTAGLIALGGCSATSVPATASTAPPPPPQPAAALAAASLPPSTSAPSVDVRPILLNAAVRDVENAEDIPSAVAAYGRGVAIDPDSLLLNRAYVLRMIELEVPEQALDAAEKVLARQPADGLSRGVLAFTEARAGQMVEALTNIALATKQAPDDAFVQDTAGHLLAWYDRVTAPPAMPDSVRDAVRHVHATLDNEVVFGAAYQDAALYYLDQRRQQQTAQAKADTDTGPTGPPPPTVSVDGPVGGTAAGPVMFAPTGADAADESEPDPADYAAPLAAAWEPGFWGYPAAVIVIVPEVFRPFPGGHRRREHHRPSPPPTRRHDAEVTFRDRFFGGGYRSVDVNGGRGVTALAYLHDRFPAAFPMNGGASAAGMPSAARPAERGRAGASGERVTRGLAGPTSTLGRVGAVREEQLRVGGPARVVSPGAPGGVISGSPGYTHYSPYGLSVGGAVNLAAPGVNPGSFGAAGIPPGFIAVPTAPPTAQPARGAVRGGAVARPGNSGGGR